MIEEWRDIKLFEGFYQVSNFGRVRSCTRTITYRNGVNHRYDGTIMIPRLAGHGYVQIRLCKDNHYTHLYVHRLVAEAFIENPQNLPEVNHKDENKQNNCVDNLEWCDKTYNVNYGTGIKRAVKSKMERGISRAVVLEEEEEIRIFPNIISAARLTGVSAQSICAYCKQGNKKWKYLESFFLRRIPEWTGLEDQEGAS